jgi:Spy/CpxP family protein refolding chaperone
MKLRWLWIPGALAALALAATLAIGAVLVTPDPEIPPADAGPDGAVVQDRDPGDAGPGDRPEGGMRERGSLERRRMMMERMHGMARQLDLSREQRDKIEAIRDRQQRQMIRQRADLATARLDLKRLLREERIDRVAVNRQIDALARLRADMAKARIGTMLEIRDVLTPDQRQKMREHRMGGDEMGPGGREMEDEGED